MGKYRTFYKKGIHLDDSLDPKKSASYGNAQHKSGKSSGNCLPALGKCQWAKRKKSSLNLKGVQNLRLILFFGASFFILQHCTSSPVSTDAGSFTITGNDDQSKVDASGSGESVQANYDAWLLPRNCTPPSSEEFPTDLFTLEQRQNGAIAIHFFAVFYMLYALLLACDKYFVPAIECICEELHIAPNVAGATFMAISTSAPELFTNVIGTFVTKGDLGVGTIVGSAVFNVLAVGSCVGIGTNIAVNNVPAGLRKIQRKGVPLDWWSLSRDTAYYLLSVAILLAVLFDGRVYWYEAAVMLAVYGLYIAGMCYDVQCKEFTETIIHKLRSTTCICGDNNNDDDDDKPKRKLSTILKQKLEEAGEETSPLIAEVEDKGYGTQNGRTTVAKKNSHKMSLVEVLSVPNELFDSDSLSSNSSNSSDSSIISTVATLGVLKDILSFPILLALRFTIPDSRNEKMRKWCGLSLLCCVAWIGGLSYLISWMVCIIGETLEIPDSVSGLTFLAAGTSFPEVLSSVIVARQGLGSMGFSNSVGSNTFDILICLGLPWLIQSLILTSHESNFIAIHSSGLEYSTGLLIASMIILYLMIAMNGYVIDTKVGVSCFLMYVVFITLACLLEMNVFFPVNLPPC